MPDEALDAVLKMVADGRLTAAEAAPIIDALTTGHADDPDDRDVPGGQPEHARVEDDEPGRLLRVVVTEAGRPVVNLNIPLSLGRMALNRLPGLSGSTSELIRQAIEAGRKASIVEIDDDGDGVRISIE